MNNTCSSVSDQHKALQILNELADNGFMSQRTLSKRLGIALGLVNSYMKHLVSKGYIKVTSIPPRRYAYYLTPKGFYEKTRLTYHLLQNYTKFYRQARADIKKLFGQLQSMGVKRVVFAGADEIAEIAYITLQETDIELSGIVDEETAGKEFFGRKILRIKDIHTLNHDSIIITSYGAREKLYAGLIKSKIEEKDIKFIFDI
jgi:DNA-binding Lrp family transcriptional regulator